MMFNTAFIALLVFLILARLFLGLYDSYTKQQRKRKIIQILK